MSEKIKFKNLSQERLKELLKYNPTTGIFTWQAKSSKYSPILVGTRADRLHPGSGYYRIQIDGERYAAHRLAWLYTYGYLPDDEIDHINNDRSDNSIDNLRLADGKNNWNTSLRVDSTTGVKGVTFHPCTGKYQARVQFQKVMYRLGLFATVAEAEQVVRKKREELHKEFANHG